MTQELDPSSDAFAVMPNKSQRRPTSIEENILPMINIVFLLLIFFMVSGQIKESDPVVITPPDSVNEIELYEETNIVFVDQNKGIFFEEHPYSFSTFEAELLNWVHLETEVFWVVKADANLKGEDLVQLMQILAQAGIKEVELVTLKS